MKFLYSVATGCLLAALLLPTALAGSLYSPDLYYWEQEHPLEHFQCSPWAEESVETFLRWKTIPVGEEDLRQPVSRGDFAEIAAAFTAMAWDSNIDGYLLITACRGEATLTRLDVGLSLGIIQGREDGDLCLRDSITRQEAAVMLARTYRLYHEVPEMELAPLSFLDRDEIAPWAIEEVQLMASLGVLKGKEDHCFDPLGTFTKEQYLATLVRLKEVPSNTGRLNNPFLLLPEPGFVQVWDRNSPLSFALETEDFFVCAREVPQLSAESVMGNLDYCIQIVDRNGSMRTYSTPILQSASYRGVIHARPETPTLSPDGLTLYYTATLTSDAYRTYYDEHATFVEELIFPKGVYTVTMDLLSGAQTYMRADLPSI